MKACACGCGALVRRRFLPGHQNRVDGWAARDAEIVARLKAGETHQSIAKDVGVTSSRVQQIASREGLLRGTPRGASHPRWKGQQRMRGGYVRVWAPDHPRAYRGTVREHILVAERTIGRSLRSGEVVHHINGVRDDNRPENLQVMTIGEHMRLHNLCYSDGLLLDWLRWIALRLNRTPQKRDTPERLPAFWTTYFERFGSWTNACRAAGLTPNGAGHGGATLPLNFRRRYAHLQKYRTAEALANALHGGIKSEHERRNETIENRGMAS